MLDDDTVLMIYEYSGGTHRYELALTKGKIDAGESPFPTWRFFKPSLSPARTRFKEISHWAKIGFC
jgi:hypothetical protein